MAVFTKILRDNEQKLRCSPDYLTLGTLVLAGFRIHAETQLMSKAKVITNR